MIKKALARAAAVALVGIGAGVSVAATGGASPVIKACVNNKTHVICKRQGQGSYNLNNATVTATQLQASGP
jgi:hypothetical protein